MIVRARALSKDGIVSNHILMNCSKEIDAVIISRAIGIDNITTYVIPSYSAIKVNPIIIRTCSSSINFVIVNKGIIN